MISTERLAAQPGTDPTTAVSRAAELLRAGHLVAFPTETVYGLGGLATSPAAVASIFAAKKRPAFNPLISHYASIETLAQDVVVSPMAAQLLEALSPGALTLVLPVSEQTRICELARSGLRTAAVRVPDHGLARDLLRQVNAPVAAPSANLSGRLTPTTADAVIEQLGGSIDAVLDGGPCSVGVESTIVAVSGDEIHLLRPGGVPAEQIETLTGRALQRPALDATARPIAPGQLASHYAPNAVVILNAETATADAAVLDFAGTMATMKDKVRAYLDLSEAGDTREAAANLYAYLRELDRAAPAAISVAPVPSQELGEAINDRLRRAAAPRPR